MATTSEQTSLFFLKLDSCVCVLVPLLEAMRQERISFEFVADVQIGRRHHIPPVLWFLSEEASDDYLRVHDISPQSGSEAAQTLRHRDKLIQAHL